MTKESVYSDEPQPLRAPRAPIARYLFVYPLWKKREWYALPAEERTRDHARATSRSGRRYATDRRSTPRTLSASTTRSSCVAFDTDDPADFLDLVQRAEGHRVERVHASETPIFTCISASVERALNALDGEAMVTSLSET